MRLILCCGRTGEHLSGVERCNSALEKELSERGVRHEWLTFATTDAQSRGQFSRAGLNAAVTGLVKLMTILARSRGNATLYLPLSQGGLGLLRDMIVLHVARACPGVRVVLHLHGEFIPSSAWRQYSYWVAARLSNRRISCVHGHVFSGRVTSYVSNLGMLGYLRSDMGPLTSEPSDAEPVRIGYLGLIAPGKAVDELVQAASALSRKVVLRLVGTVASRQDALSGGSDFEAFRENVAGHSSALVGPLYGHAKFQEIATWNVAVFPSKSEGLPLALLEARLLGVPVVARRVGDLGRLASLDAGTVLFGESTSCDLSTGIELALALAPLHLPMDLQAGAPGFGSEVLTILESV